MNLELQRTNLEQQPAVRGPLEIYSEAGERRCGRLACTPKLRHAPEKALEIV